MSTTERGDELYEHRRSFPPCRALIAGSIITTLSLANLARADVLILENGNRIEGRVELLESGQYRVTIDEGNVVTLRSSDVRERQPGEAPIDELTRRLKALEKGDRRALIELAAWAEVKGLRKSSLAVYRRLLALDPHHEGARQRLGYVVYKNRWVRRSELKGRGLVRFRGAWHVPEEVDRIRASEAVAEFLTLLGDVHHQNKFIRENARLRLIKVQDERLVPFLIEKLSAKSAVDRLTCGRILTNFGFDISGPPLYRALFDESVGECVDGFTALLGRFGRAELGQWVARDLRRAVADPKHLARLIGLVENFPHRDAIGPVIDVMEAHRAWSRRIDRALVRLLGLESRSAFEWRGAWAQMRDRVGVDLGTGWVRAKRKRRP